MATELGSELLDRSARSASSRALTNSGKRRGLRPGGMGASGKRLLSGRAGPRGRKGMGRGGSKLELGRLVPQSGVSGRSSSTLWRSQLSRRHAALM